MANARGNLAIGLWIVLLLSASLFGQDQGRLRGQVTDQTGAIVRGATITLSGAVGPAKTAIAAKDGSYSFGDLPPGDYTVQASAPSLALLEPVTVSVKPGVQTLNLQLRVVAVKQEVLVQENSAPAVS